MRKVIYWVKELFRNFMMRILALVFPIDNNKVLFASFGGKQYSDNPRFISEKLHELNAKCDIVWIFDDTEKHPSVPNYIRMVKHKSIRNYYELVTAKVWVFNVDVRYGTYKRKGQYYIQTWHGDRGFKKIKYDAVECMGEKKYKETHLIEPRICDLCIAGSEFGQRVYQSAFHYSGKILKNGMPRNDCLVNVDKYRVINIKETLKINDANVLLYAPTFRDNRKTQVIPFDINRVLDALERMYNCKWVCLVRAHVMSSFTNEKYNGVIDVSQYEDMADLLLISDILISDYSSSISDFALKKAPIILYQYDVDDFIKNCRAFYDDVIITETGLPTVTNESDLEKVILSIKQIDFGKLCDELLGKFGTNEKGESALEIAKIIKSYVS